MPLSILTLTIITLIKISISIMTLRITASSIKACSQHSAFNTLNINDSQHNGTAFRVSFVMLSIAFFVLLSVIRLNVGMPSVMELTSKAKQF